MVVVGRVAVGWASGRRTNGGIVHGRKQAPACRCPRRSLWDDERERKSRPLLRDEWSNLRAPSTMAASLPTWTNLSSRPGARCAPTARCCFRRVRASPPRARARLLGTSTRRAGRPALTPAPPGRSRRRRAIDPRSRRSSLASVSGATADAPALGRERYWSRGSSPKNRTVFQAKNTSTVMPQTRSSTGRSRLGCPRRCPQSIASVATR